MPARAGAYRRPRTETAASTDKRRNPSWATLMHRAFKLEVLAYPCGGQLRLIATVRDTQIARRILRHLGLPADPVHPAPARAPPSFDDLEVEHSA